VNRNRVSHRYLFATHDDAHEQKGTPMYIGVGAVVLILAIIVLFMLFRGRSTI
jgi:hypothetical protein